jgi:hypothetical protein
MPTDNSGQMPTLVAHSSRQNRHNSERPASAAIFVCWFIHSLDAPTEKMHQEKRNGSDHGTPLAVGRASGTAIEHKITPKAFDHSAQRGGGEGIAEVRHRARKLGEERALPLGYLKKRTNSERVESTISFPAPLTPRCSPAAPGQMPKCSPP